MNWMLALENESFLFFFSCRNMKRLDRERGEGVRQHALNMA